MANTLEIYFRLCYLLTFLILKSTFINALDVRSAFSETAELFLTLHSLAHSTINVQDNPQISQISRTIAC